MKIKVLIVDDELMVRRGLLMSLNLETDLRVVGEASNGEEALHLAEELKPDVVVMDIEMPGMDGVQAAAALTANDTPGPRVIMLSLHDDAEMRARAQTAGASGFISKNAPFEDLLAEIRQQPAADR